MQGTGWRICCVALLASCAPDRLYVEGTHGWGAIDPAFKDGTFDTESDALTVGLSFPLCEPHERVTVERYITGPTAPASLVAHPGPPAGTPANGGVPWEEILLYTGGIATTLGAQRGGRQFSNWRTARKSQKADC